MDELLNIERKYDVGKIEVNGEQIWPVFRMFLYSTLFGKQSRKMHYGLCFIFSSMKSAFYGCFNWFNKYEIICISSSGGGYRRMIDGKYFNRFVDPVIDKLGVNRVLMVEKPDPLHFPLKLTYTKYIVSERLLDLFTFILSYFITYEIKNDRVLDLIKQDYFLQFNERRFLKLFVAEKLVYTYLYKLYKPKAVFITCFYNREAKIRAAKELGIPVIEIQHGIIGPNHYAYNHKVMSRDYYPDYLLSFVEYEYASSSEDFIFEKDRVYPVGNYYIDYINSKEISNPLRKLTNKYKRSVAVTLQSTVEEETVEFVVEAAELDPDIIYFLLPRPAKDDFGMHLPSNVKIINSLNFYKMMACVDYHSTVYSTCAIEAPSLGVQNILINLHNKSKEYYSNLLTDEKITKYVETPKEYVQTINRFKKLDKKTIRSSNNHIFVQNYHKNLKKFLTEMLIYDP